MGSMKGLAAVLGVAVLMIVVAACGTSDLDTRDGHIEIAHALEASVGSEVTVSGFLIANRDGSTRLCSGLLESSPPQCAGDRIDLLGFDASTVNNSKTPQEPSEIQTVRWTDTDIIVTGTRVNDGLAEVRLSTEVRTVNNYLSLVDDLRAAGVTVDRAGNVTQPFFAPQGQVLTVNGEDVQTFEFASAEEADAVAEGVSANGDTISRVDTETGLPVATSVLWNAPPHFYKAGKLIVIYVGSDSDVIDALQEAMGSQFAGGEI